MSMTDTKKKAWLQPEILSVGRMKAAAGGDGSGVSKGPTTIEYDYNGPGS